MLAGSSGSGAVGPPAGPARARLGRALLGRPRSTSAPRRRWCSISARIGPAGRRGLPGRHRRRARRVDRLGLRARRRRPHRHQRARRERRHRRAGRPSPTARRVPAQVIGKDEETDLAVLRVGARRARPAPARARRLRGRRSRATAWSRSATRPACSDRRDRPHLRRGSAGSRRRAAT